MRILKYNPTDDLADYASFYSKKPIPEESER